MKRTWLPSDSPYASLERVLLDAMIQASNGKGKERHAGDGEYYEDQVMCEITRRLGPGYPLGQAVKKIIESQRLGGDAGIQELLGAINYIAGAIIVLQEQQHGKEHKGNEAIPKAAPGSYRGSDFGFYGAEKD
jgi:hypothetical protein